jgi:hypothetical protein
MNDRGRGRYIAANVDEGNDNNDRGDVNSSDSDDYCQSREKKLKRQRGGEHNNTSSSAGSLSYNVTSAVPLHLRQIRKPREERTIIDEIDILLEDRNLALIRTINSKLDEVKSIVIKALHHQEAGTKTPSGIPTATAHVAERA